MNTLSMRSHLNNEDLFGRQPTKTCDLPDPEPLLKNLARCVVEVLSGVRDLEQIARWLDENVYHTLRHRATLNNHLQTVKKQTPHRPVFNTGQIILCEPGEGIIEATIIVSNKTRSRAVAIRLEGLDNRWRATAINIP